MTKREARSIARLYMEQGYSSYEEDLQEVAEDLRNSDYTQKEIDIIVKELFDLVEYSIYGYIH